MADSITIVVLGSEAALAQTFSGSEHGHTLRVTSSADVLYGKGGNDFLFGYGGDDTLWGDADNDDLYGGPATTRSTGVA